VVAVRRLTYWSSFQFHELKDKLLLATKLRHHNVVQLLGVCLEQREALLVYEYLPNASLDTILFGKLIARPFLVDRHMMRSINSVDSGPQNLLWILLYTQQSTYRY
jgi:hypothetical protein